PDYRLAPGDLLDVQIAGRLEVIRQQAVVDLEGAINVPPLGAIPVAGLTLLEAHRKVAARARDVFRFADATLTVVAPRTFEVTVSGEVDRPGTVQTAATRRVYDVILEAGGVTPRGGPGGCSAHARGLRRPQGSNGARSALGAHAACRRHAATGRRDLRPGDLLAAGPRRGPRRVQRHRREHEDDGRRQIDDPPALRVGAGRARARRPRPGGRRRRVRGSPSGAGRPDRGDRPPATDPDR